MKDSTISTGDAPSFAELFTPKLVTVLHEGYGLLQFRADAIAGLTVAIVALPLSMAIAIASGATPAQGLYTAIIGGFFVSLLGGSRFQIGGPAGAFIVLVAATVAQHGMDGLILATFLSGLMLTTAGFLRLGTFIKFIPFPVTIGFTAGIAVIIFASQIKDLFGLALDHEPSSLLEKLPVLWAARSSFTPAALGVSIAVVAIVIGLRKVRPHWPGMLIAVALGAVATTVLNLPIQTHWHEIRGYSIHSAPAKLAELFSWQNNRCPTCSRLVHPSWFDRVTVICRRGRWHDRAAASFQLRIGRTGHC